MQTIFEIFTAKDGRTQGYRHSEAKAKQTCDRINPVDADGLMKQGAPFHDYLPATHEGFYVVDDMDCVRMVGSKPLILPTKAQADTAASMANMASDRRTYRAVEHRLA